MPAMLRAIRKSRFSPRLLGGLALVLLLGVQVLESTHLHVAGVDAPECLQCQAEPQQALPTSQAIASSAPVDHTIHGYANAVAPQSTPSHYSARAPPVLSS